MQTSREPNIVLAGTQVPIERPEQVVVDAIITGIALSHVWRVIDIVGTNVYVMKLPQTTTPCSVHRFEPLGRGRTCAVCHMREAAIGEFLPTVVGKSRMHIITPNGPLQTTLPYTLYGYMQGDALQTVQLDTSGNWSQALPLIPSLEILWRLPAELQSLLTSPIDTEEFVPED